MDLRLLKWNGLYLSLGTIHLLPGMGGRGGGESVRGFLGRSHGFSREQRSQSVFNRGQRGDYGKLITNKEGGSVIRLLQSLFQSLIGSLGISYCGTNKTPPKPVPHPSIGDK